MTRKPDDWMPLHIGPYMADTTNLTRDQHGAYLLLLMAYWRRGGPLVADDGQLAAMAKATPAEWRKIKPVLLQFFTVKDGYWNQRRCDDELVIARGLVEAKSAAGKAGAAARWQTQCGGNGRRNAVAMREQCQTDAPKPQPEPEHLNLNTFSLGRKSGVIPMTDQNKIALFQSWLADLIGKDGWRIVGEAADPESPNYERALAFCKERARAGGKGWPHKWPMPVAA